VMTHCDQVDLRHGLSADWNAAGQAVWLEHARYFALHTVKLVLLDWEKRSGAESYVYSFVMTSWQVL